MFSSSPLDFHSEMELEFKACHRKESLIQLHCEYLFSIQIKNAWDTFKKNLLRLGKSISFIMSFEKFDHLNLN